MYKWCGDNKLYIPGFGQINPGALFELPEEQKSRSGVQSLIAEKLIVEQVKQSVPKKEIKVDKAHIDKESKK